MKPVLLIYDPSFVVSAATEYQYNGVLRVALNRMGIPCVAKSLTDSDMQTATIAANYSCAIITRTNTATAGNQTALAAWLAGNIGIPVVMYAYASAMASIASPAITTGIPAGLTDTSFAPNVAYAPCIDADGNRLYFSGPGYNSVPYRYFVSFTGTLNGGAVPLFWTDDANLRPFVWTIGSGVNTRYFSSSVDPLLLFTLICKALTAAGITPKRPFKFYQDVDDVMPQCTDARATTGLGLSQYAASLRARNTYSVIGLNAGAAYATYVAANPGIVAILNANQDVFKCIPHNHTLLIFSNDSAYPTVASKITAVATDLAAGIAAGLPLDKCHYNGYMYLPANHCSHLGREAALKLGVTCIREATMNTLGTTTSGFPFSFHEAADDDADDTYERSQSGFYRGEVARAFRVFSYTFDFPVGYVDGNMHKDSRRDADADEFYVRFSGSWSAADEFTVTIDGVATAGVRYDASDATMKAAIEALFTGTGYDGAVVTATGTATATRKLIFTYPTGITKNTPMVMSAARPAGGVPTVLADDHNTLNYFLTRCAYWAFYDIVFGQHIIWIHGAQLTLEADSSRGADQSVMEDYLDVFNAFVNVTDGWVKWATTSDDRSRPNLRPNPRGLDV